jgi:hypothetical protein
MRFVPAVVLLVGTSSATAANPPLRAFERPASAADRMPTGTVRLPYRIVDSRRIATYIAPRRPSRRATLYLLATQGHGLCVFLVQPRSAGGGCGSDFPATRKIAASEGKFFAGVVANEVARVVIVGTRGVRHVVPLTRDNGFIYDCRAYNGCTCVVAAVEAFSAGGKLVERQDWRSRACRSTR